MEIGEHVKEGIIQGINNTKLHNVTMVCKVVCCLNYLDELDTHCILYLSSGFLTQMVIGMTGKHGPRVTSRVVQHLGSNSVNVSCLTMAVRVMDNLLL